MYFAEEYNYFYNNRTFHIQRIILKINIGYKDGYTYVSNICIHKVIKYDKYTKPNSFQQCTALLQLIKIYIGISKPLHMLKTRPLKAKSCVNDKTKQKT